LLNIVVGAGVFKDLHHKIVKHFVDEGQTRGFGRRVSRIDPKIGSKELGPNPNP
jgi:hypothetical protein